MCNGIYISYNIHKSGVNMCNGIYIFVNTQKSNILKEKIYILAKINYLASGPYIAF